MPDLILKKDTPRAAAGLATPTPLAFPALARPRRDPPGGPRAPISLPLCVTPYSHSGLTGWSEARTGERSNGVGGAALSYPGQRGRVGLTMGVRT